MNIYVLPTSVVADSVSPISYLNGSNFDEWKECIMFKLGYKDLDLAFRVDDPSPLTAESCKCKVQSAHTVSHQGFNGHAGKDKEGPWKKKGKKIQSQERTQEDRLHQVQAVAGKERAF